MAITRPPVPLTCPSWCEAHDPEDLNRLGGGVTTQHESKVLTWSDDAHSLAGIRRIDEFDDGRLEGIYIDRGDDAIWDITADQARRLAEVLLALADQVEQR